MSLSDGLECVLNAFKTLEMRKERNRLPLIAFKNDGSPYNLYDIVYYEVFLLTRIQFIYDKKVDNLFVRSEDNLANTFVLADNFYRMLYEKYVDKWDTILADM